MSVITGSSRHIWKISRLRYLHRPLWASQGSSRTCRALSRNFSDGGPKSTVEEAVVGEDKGGFWGEYKRSFEVRKPDLTLQTQLSRELVGKEFTIVGSLGKKRDAGAQMTFADLFGEGGLQKLQLFARSEISGEALQALRSISVNSAISATGTLALKLEPKAPKGLQEKPPQPEDGHVFLSQLELRVQSISCLNSFPKEFEHPSAKDRHLQIRFNPELKKRLEFRSKVAAFARQNLQDFTEVETPILFKSTPEGAREFIVPTRIRGHAYSLPQSPQQYKQLLIASGMHRYMQFAKCFRDEDHRADRQPEFTQLDLEMAWADGEDVMNRVEELMKTLWREFSVETPLPTFQRIRYNDAMARYGSDKPDLRIPGSIHRIDHIIPDNLRGMLTYLKDPIVETFKIQLNGDSKSLKQFNPTFMDSQEGVEFRNNPDGAPGAFLYDPTLPLNGLHAFGFESAEQLEALFNAAASSPNSTESPLDQGDIILVQARENTPHSGGSTMLGKLRRSLYLAATEAGLAELDPQDRFLWVTDFPMFTPNDADGPNDQGTSGFSATHHPFTAPKSAADVDLLLTDPLGAIADHYDLVLNGVELGGGSRRIHNSEMQQFIMKDILKMNQNLLDSFAHLFKALQAGCPPHAGLAIGFDRLIAVMTGQNSVRDVIAFPKDKLGKDLLVKSPGPLLSHQLLEYHLQVTTPEEPTKAQSNSSASSTET